MKRFLIGLAVSLLATGFYGTKAFAGHCGRDIRAIGAALQTATLSKKQLAKLKALRNKGVMLHEKNHHRTSLKNLHAALKILGIKHR
jgi:hypothetical protein